MSGIWGKNIKISIFGESHGRAIGITIDGLPSGFELDIEKIEVEIARRAPGQGDISTPRSERDKFQILSGYFDGKTTGTPLCSIIENTNLQSKDYSKTKNLMRPGHADYTGFIKYDGFNDYRGGGHFSGRITAPLVFAGAIAKQILEKENIIIGAHIKSVGQIEEEFFDDINLSEESLRKIHDKAFPTIDDARGEAMKNEILHAKEEMDSVGGIIETAVINLPSGIGSPFFDSLESHLAQLLFSIPAVKGVEFGKGFNISKLKGSTANDQMYVKDNKIKCYTNNNGGIVGGITNGMPLIFRIAFKPTPSIARPQKTVDIEKMEDSIIEIKGRHDPCVVHRAVPVVEAVAALAILDLMGER